MKLAGVWRPVVEEALDWGERNLEIFDYRYLRRLQRITSRNKRSAWNSGIRWF